MKMLLKLSAGLTLLGAALGTASTAQAQEPLIGQITPFAFNFCPRGWTHAQGQLLPISSNDALFSIYGTIYGGDGRTTFALPQLAATMPMGAGTGPGRTPRREGQFVGTQTRTLTSTQMPSHSHTFRVQSETTNMNSNTGVNSTLMDYGNAGVYVTGRNADRQMYSQMVVPTGGNQPFVIQQPILAVTYCVATVGIYPSRS